MDIRQLQYLVALAREKHFTRAAQACHVTQSTLSGRIRQLEQELGVPIVERGQRFHGFTPDGERVLKRAQVILGQCEALQQEIASRRATSGSLSGRLSVGVIPSALPMAELITKAIHDRHPDVDLVVLSQSSIDILRNLEDFAIDIGLTYLDNEPIEGMRAEAVYMERIAERRAPRVTGGGVLMWKKRVVGILAAITLGVALGTSGSHAQSKASVILATTTSTQDSGLLDVLVPRFERERGIEVKVIAVGTGAALRMAGTGDADVVLVHAPAAEAPYVEAGDLIDGSRVMHNEFVIVGPSNDPAGARKARSVREVMRAIAAAGSVVSRGDQSGTHIQEMALWAAAGIDARQLGRREETGQGMGATLNVADQKRAYTLTDRGTYLAQRARLALTIVFQGDPSLRNVYHVYAVNPAKHRKARYADAKQFIDFLVSTPIQQVIGAFKRDEFGESLFFPDAVPREGR